MLYRVVVEVRYTRAHHIYASNTRCSILKRIVEDGLAVHVAKILKRGGLLARMEPIAVTYTCLRLTLIHKSD